MRTDEDLVIAVTGFVDSALEAGDSVDRSRGARFHAERTGRGVRAARRQHRPRWAPAVTRRSSSTIARFESILAGGIPDGDLFAAARWIGNVDRALSAATSSQSARDRLRRIAPLLGAHSDINGMLRLERIASMYSGRTRYRFCAATRPDVFQRRAHVHRDLRAAARPSFQRPRTKSTRLNNRENGLSTAQPMEILTMHMHKLSAPLLRHLRRAIGRRCPISVSRRNLIADTKIPAREPGCRARRGAESSAGASSAVFLQCGRAPPPRTS